MTTAQTGAALGRTERTSSMCEVITLPPLSGSPIKADLVADKVGDVRGKIVLIVCNRLDYLGVRFTEWLLLRLFVDLGVRFADFVDPDLEYREVISQAAELAGVADRVRFVPYDRLLVA